MTTAQRNYTSDPTEVMHLRVTQHPHTFFKSLPEHADAIGNDLMKLEQDVIIPLDRIVIHDKIDSDYLGPENVAEYKQHHKIVCTYPLGEAGPKSGYIFAPHVELYIPPNFDNRERLLMPRSAAGAFLKQGMGDRETMGDDNLFHLHEGKGLYLDSIARGLIGRADEIHYKVELSKPLNGKRNWYVLKEEVEIWQEYQGPILVWDNIPPDLDR